MRKSLFLTLVLSLCVADFGAFAATARGNTRGGASTNANAATQVAPVSARAGARQKVVSAPTTTSSASAPVSARAGARQKVASVPTTTAKTSSGNGNVAARAATKKAALSMGTKVAAATENTAVSQECQDAYYGCMDTFCMLDNATGGRCQCSDRSAELDAVMDEIMRLDEQSARIATEGVEQIQMGDYANQINARAKSVESGLNSSDKKSEAEKNKTLDLASLMNNNLFDVEIGDDDIFGDETGSSPIDDIAGKTGDALQKAVAKVCVERIPAQCKSSSALLQMAYVQKVKSDCVGYENALKQQRNASQQKLLTAQKAVRDAALDEVRKQNRYETVGECAVAFAQCMQTTAECGSDYTGCVTLAAANNLKASINDDNNNKQSKSPKGNNNNNKGGTSNKTTVKTAASYTIKGVVSGADITIAASTMEALLAKKEICASVTKQCVNANKNDAVWNVFLRNVAPALKSAELIAEQNLRSSCLPTVAECFRNSCKSQFGENDESYDMCLSNPDTYKSLCKVQLEPCLNATGGTYENPEDSTLWTGLIAMLNSMKVDACTKEVKDCLLSEDRCGKDYSGCIGLDTYTIGNLCPIEKLTACVSDGQYADGKGGVNDQAIREYVAKVAQGLALNIDNSFATVCQDAAEAALVKACGDGGSGEEDALCPNLDMNLSALTSVMHVAYQEKDDKSKYYNSVEEYIKDKNLGVNNMKELFNLQPLIVGQTDVYGIKYNQNAKNTYDTKDAGDFDCYETTGASSDNGYTGSTGELLSQIRSKYNLLLNQIKSDPTVTFCMSGREVQGFNAGEKFGKSQGQGGRFPKLLNATKQQLASQILNTVWNKYETGFNEVSEKLKDEYQNLAKRLVDYVNDAELDVINENACKENDGVGVGCIGDFWTDACGPRYRHIFDAHYDSATNKCTIYRTTYYCRDWTYRGHPRAAEEWVKAECNVEKEHEPKIIDYPSANR